MRIVLTGLVSLLTVSSLSAASAHPHNDVNVIRPPVPSYPIIAVFFGASAECMVDFELLDYGRTKQIQSVSCTNLLFCSESAKAIREAEFEVTDIPGTESPGRRTNITYPVSYVLENKPEVPNAKLQLCPPVIPGPIG